jgi:hypothetical protein
MTTATTTVPRHPRAGTALPDPARTRLEALRRLAKTDPVAAGDAAWTWFREAGDRIAGDRDRALEELGKLFADGSPSLGLDGRTEGMLVGWCATPVFDRVMSLITGAWLPWTGKRFHADTNTGDNLLLGSARWPAKLLWPLYSTRPEGHRRSAFDFRTRVEAGALDPGTDVLVIDYASVVGNPRLFIKQIRDELVEVVPGAHLGKMLLRHGTNENPEHTLLAYFALKSAPATP